MISSVSARITAQNIQDEIVNLGQIVLEVTDECNLSCMYCAYGDLYGGYDKRKAQYMRFDDAKAVFDYLVDIWRKYPTQALEQSTDIGFYGGEPLLNFPLIQQVVNYVESLDISRFFRFSMTSNCMLLDRYMDFLVEKQFSLLCSLDGDKNADSYRVRHNGDSSFEKVVENLLLLKNKYPDYFESSVYFNSVLHNLNSVEGTTAFIKETFGKVPLFSELATVGVRPDMVEKFQETFNSVSESIHSAKNCDVLRNVLGEDNPETQEVFRFINSEGDVYYSYLDLFLSGKERVRIPTGTCIPFSRKMFVKVDGKILQCERIPHKYSLGVVKNGKVYLDFERIAQTFNSYLDRMQLKCAVCGRKLFCDTCFYEVSGIDDNNPVKCPDFMTSEQFDNYRNSCLSYLFRYPETYRKAIYNSMIE